MKPPIARRLRALALLLFLPSASALANPLYAVYRSTDQGRTWTPAGEALPPSARVNAFTRVDNVVWAGTDAGLFRSPDLGRVWSRTTDPTLLDVRITALQTVGNSVFAGSDRSGLFTSADLGATWKRLPGYTPARVRCLHASGRMLFVGTDSHGVWVSDDLGVTWTSRKHGLPEDAQIFALSDWRGRLYAATYNNGLHAWDNRAQTWIRQGPEAPLALASTPTTLVVGRNPGGLRWSTDPDGAWTHSIPNFTAGLNLQSVARDSGEPLDPTAPVWELTASGRHLWAGAADGIFLSDDDGRSWIRAGNGLPPHSPGISFLLTEDVFLAGLQRASSR